MKVEVDHARCQGHGRCHVLAPELFDLDDLGFSEVRGGGAVAEGMKDRARSAVDNCPEYAIAIVEE